MKFIVQIGFLASLLLPFSIMAITHQAKAESSFVQARVENQNFAETQEFAFRVFLDEREMGRHTVTVVPADDGTRVSIAADFKVKILFYTAFKYTHRVEELWKDDCLVSIDATTDNNGEDLFLNGRQGEQFFGVTSHLGEQSLEGCVRSFAYWNPDLLESSALLNMQTSEYEQTSFKSSGRETLTINGQDFVADKFILTAGEKELSLWYSPEKQWLALQSRTEDDYLVTYYTEAAYD